MQGNNQKLMRCKSRLRTSGGVVVLRQTAALSFDIFKFKAMMATVLLVEKLISTPCHDLRPRIAPDPAPRFRGLVFLFVLIVADAFFLAVYRRHRPVMNGAEAIFR